MFNTRRIFKINIAVVENLVKYWNLILSYKIFSDD